jgi:hypothetical protein
MKIVMREASTRERYSLQGNMGYILGEQALIEIK